MGRWANLLACGDSKILIYYLERSRMGVLKKIGLLILAYVIMGVVYTILLLNDIIIRDGNILIETIHIILTPIVLPTNFLYQTMPFLP